MIEWFTTTYTPADATFWVLVALLMFIGLLVWQGVPKMVGKQLDERAERIQKELDDARRMREEAQELLASYQRRQREAEGEAEALIAQAKAEADRLREETREALADRLERRTRMAEEKIARAEAQAEAEVRAAAADLAVEAAGKIIAEKLDDSARQRLFDQSVSELERRLQ